MNIINRIDEFLTPGRMKIINLVFLFVIVYYFIKGRYIRLSIEGFDGDLDAEAIANLASLWQSDNFKVTNLEVTGDLKVNGKSSLESDLTLNGNSTINGNINSTGSATIGNAYIGIGSTDSPDSYVIFTHKDRTGNDFAFGATKDGDTYVNSGLNKGVRIRSYNGYKNATGNERQENWEIAEFKYNDIKVQYPCTFNKKVTVNDTIQVNGENSYVKAPNIVAGKRLKNEGNYGNVVLWKDSLDTGKALVNKDKTWNNSKNFEMY